MPCSGRVTSCHVASDGVAERVVREYERRFPGIFGHVAARTKIFDAAFEDAVAASHQIVLLGAGFDSRFFRVPAARGVACYEIDTLGTQQRKIACLEAAGIAHNHVAFIPVDFGRENLFER